MADLVGGLRKVMEEQRDRFRESASLARRQREALLGRDTAKLAQFTREEQAIGQALHELDAERKQAWTRIAAEAGRPEAELTWDVLADKIPPEDSERFSALLTELNDLLRELITENATNIHLIRKGMEVSEFTLRVAGQAAAGTYGPDGRREGGIGRGGVDRTA